MTKETRKIASKKPQEADERENPSLLKRPRPYPGCEHPRARALPGVRTRATRVLLVPLPAHVLVPVTALNSS